jgi:hypothetical protein
VAPGISNSTASSSRTQQISSRLTSNAAAEADVVEAFHQQRSTQALFLQACTIDLLLYSTELETELVK